MIRPRGRMCYHPPHEGKFPGVRRFRERSRQSPVRDDAPYPALARGSKNFHYIIDFMGVIFQAFPGHGVPRLRPALSAEFA